MVDFLAIFSNLDNVYKLATSELNKYNYLDIIAQAQIGIKVIVKNSQFRVAMDVMSEVMRDSEKEAEQLKIQLIGTKAKLGRPLTNKELAEFKKSRQISLMTTEQANQKLLKKCH